VRFLRYPELRTLKGVPFSRMHLGRLERAGQFPRRVSLGANTVAWREDEVDAFLSARAAERDNRQPARASTKGSSVEHDRSRGRGRARRLRKTPPVHTV
jgi:prophage regulatory protein